MRVDLETGTWSASGRGIRQAAAKGPKSGRPASKISPPLPTIRPVRYSSSDHRDPTVDPYQGDEKFGELSPDAH